MSKISKSICNSICLLLLFMAGCAGTLDNIRADFAVSRADDMYEEGDLSEAFTQYIKAAEAGSSRAQYMLGRMYAEGEGVGQNQVEAVQWISKAADNGYPAADFEMGVRYLTAYGVPADPVRGVEHFKKSAQKEHELAMYHLGFVYVFGVGVEPDFEQALRWFRMAKAHGIDVDTNLLTQSGIRAYMFKYPAPSLTINEKSDTERLFDTSKPGDVSLIQSRLSELGFYNMLVDGIWGPGSQNALRNFQKAKALEPSGVWNMETQKKLFVE